MNFSKNELHLMIEAVNHSISYRLTNRTRMSDIRELKNAKEKLNILLKETAQNKN